MSVGDINRIEVLDQIAKLIYIEQVHKHKIDHQLASIK